MALPAAGLPHSTYHYKEADIQDAENQSTILTIPVSKLRAREFRHYLVRRMPLLITGLNSELQLSWSPSQLMHDYGTEQCSVEDCEKRAPVSKQTLSHFLKNFLDSSITPDSTPVWKVKVCIG